MSLSALAEHIENVPLIDHHVHGCWLQPPDRPGSRTVSTRPIPNRWRVRLGVRHPDRFRGACALRAVAGTAEHAGRTRTGIAMRTANPTWRGCSSASQGVRLAGGHRIRQWRSRSRRAGRTVGRRAHEIVRLESVAERPSRPPATTRRRLAACSTAGETAIATKSILAYRGGFDGDLSEPASAEVAEAAQRWRDSPALD